MGFVQAMWMLSQRAYAPRGDGLGRSAGRERAKVVARAWPMPTRCSMSKTKTWGGTVAEPARSWRIARHKAFLRKQFQ